MTKNNMQFYKLMTYIFNKWLNSLWLLCEAENDCEIRNRENKKSISKIFLMFSSDLRIAKQRI